ncbi:MAG: hypothetical protein M3O21_02430 [Chloroflexota bacterium]|nr:hypothetical protein [Chloroflexota bacterium]
MGVSPWTAWLLAPFGTLDPSIRRSSGDRRAAVLVCAGAAGSLAIAPYAQSYDHVLLIPAVALTLTNQRVTSAIAILSAWIAATWAAYTLALAGDARAFAGLLPAATLVLLGGMERPR